MIALIDCDSLMYKSAYLLDSPENIEKHGLTGCEEDEIAGYMAEIAADRLERMITDILEDIGNDENNIHITGVEVYVTRCRNSIRKRLSPEYKANRKPNKIVNCLRDLYIFKNEVIVDDEFEADDLIADRARELNGNCIIVTMDKDLKQIGGFIYDFYQKPSIYDADGKEIERFPRRGLSYVSKVEARRFFAKQMLMGDSGDRVQGIPKIGDKKADAILLGKQTDFSLIKAVVKEYMSHFGDTYFEKLQLNGRLLYLGRATSILLAKYDDTVNAMIVEKG